VMASGKVGFLVNMFSSRQNFGAMRTILMTLSQP
jgi:hypothetical protein